MMMITVEFDHLLSYLPRSIIKTQVINNVEVADS